MGSNPNRITYEKQNAPDQWSGVFRTGTDRAGACSGTGRYGTGKDRRSLAHFALLM
ncbi:MAG: hypothetical protein IAB99_05460 [Bacteroidetes bacterium]|uniref:Uncharacterized protein n=1 Tax=Candidatus Cryptobacteroides faecipullorum TaxID=2840764 RepID=A0A9D9NBJ0_9BACT|nr:hypothetical protein [Candidatus Cryptobacteroides faecipullorum]